MDIAEQVYKYTATFPKEERYGITSQIQRAAVSICSNIAEGHNRRSTKEFVYFIRIALGSLAELETQLILSSRLGYLLPPALEEVLSETQSLGKMLNVMASKLTEKL